ncbi:MULTISPECIES: hypothetical protein [Burkholderia]|uniref:hypothetical protein n=1 Tax=Burkholderia TaxID=32008 RepID=UPI0012E32F51|nr:MULTISPECIES: hypothetical protein [Burkholderia]
MSIAGTVFNRRRATSIRQRIKTCAARCNQMERQDDVRVPKRMKAPRDAARLVGLHDGGVANAQARPKVIGHACRWCRIDARTL